MHSKKQNENLNTRSFKELFIQSISCLDDCNIDYVVVGGTIVPYYGATRSTQDIDILINADHITDNQVENLVTCFNALKLSVTKKEILLGFKENVHITVFDLITPIFRLDIKKIKSPLDYLTYNTRKYIELYQLKVPVSTPESLIGIKSSPGFGSNTDIEDIISILEIQGDSIDYELLNQFLNSGGGSEIFCQIIRESKLSDKEKILKNIVCS